MDGRLAASRSEGDRGVLRSLVGMMDDVTWPALAERHVEGVQNQAGAQVAGHRPADDAPAEGVEHDRKVEEPGQGGQVWALPYLP